MTIYTDNNLIDGMTCLYRITATDSLGVSTSIVVDPANMPGHSITAQAVGGDTIAYQVTLVDVGGNVDYEVYVDNEFIGSATNVPTPSVSDTLNYTLTPLPGVTKFLVSLWAAPTGSAYTLQQTIEVDLTNVVQPVTRSAQMSIRPDSHFTFREQVTVTALLDGTENSAFQILKDGVSVQDWRGLGSSGMPLMYNYRVDQLADTTSTYQLFLAEDETEGQAGNYLSVETITFAYTVCSPLSLTTWFLSTGVNGNGDPVADWGVGLKDTATDFYLKEDGVVILNTNYPNGTQGFSSTSGGNFDAITNFDAEFTMQAVNGSDSAESLPWKFLNEPSYGITITNATATADTNGFVTVTATVNYYGLTVAPNYRIQKRSIGESNLLQVYPPMPEQSIDLIGTDPTIGGSEQIEFTDSNTVIGHDYEYLIEVYQWDNDCGIYDSTYFSGTMPVTNTASTSP